MSAWPDGMTIAPLREWPGTLTPDRQRSPFSVTLSVTLEQLERELRLLDARDVELLVAIGPEQFRIDGRPRAQAKAEHPGIVLSFETDLGRQSYPCDRFETWQENLRAVMLSLEALRKVDRYGVTRRGEQYRGFLALETGATSSVQDAIDELHAIIPPDWATTWGEEPQQLRSVLAQAKRAAHPDLGGTADAFDRVTRAERVLRDAGRLAA